MEKCGLWQDILGARNLVAHHSDSLIYFVNNNCVESYNSVVAKYIGGKRVNFSFRGQYINQLLIVINCKTKSTAVPILNIGSYQTRCHTAVNAFNLGLSYISHFHKKATLQSPGLYTKKYIKKIQHKKNKVIQRNLFHKKSG